MRPIRQRPTWQVKELLRRSGVTQTDIARACGVAPPFVSRTINRAPIGNAKGQERVWQEIERVTAPLFAEAAR